MVHKVRKPMHTHKPGCCSLWNSHLARRFDYRSQNQLPRFYHFWKRIAKVSSADRPHSLYRTRRTDSQKPSAEYIHWSDCIPPIFVVLGFRLPHNRPCWRWFPSAHFCIRVECGAFRVHSLLNKIHVLVSSTIGIAYDRYTDSAFQSMRGSCCSCYSTPGYHRSAGKIALLSKYSGHNSVNTSALAYQWIQYTKTNNHSYFDKVVRHLPVVPPIRHLFHKD